MQCRQIKQNPKSVNSFPSLWLNYTVLSTRQTAISFLHSSEILRAWFLAVSHQIPFSGSPRNRNALWFTHTHTPFVSVSLSNKEYHTLYSELASFTVPCRSFQISPQKSTTSFSLVAAERPSPFVDIT